VALAGERPRAPWAAFPGRPGAPSVLLLAVLPSSERSIALLGFPSAALQALNPTAGLCQVLVAVQR